MLYFWRLKETFQRFFEDEECNEDEEETVHEAGKNFSSNIAIVIIEKMIKEEQIRDNSLRDNATLTQTRTFQ